MALLYFNCPDCQEVQLSSTAASRFIWERTPANFELYYRFGCTSCRTVVVKPSDEQIDDLLDAAGVVQTKDISFPYEEVQDPVRTNEYNQQDTVADYALEFHELVWSNSHLAAIARNELRDVSGL